MRLCRPLPPMFARLQNPYLLLTLTVLFWSGNMVLGRAIRDQVPPDVPFFSVNTYDQGLQFYLKRTTTMVSYQDELGFGIAQEPEKFLKNLDAFKQAWNTAPQAWALLNPDTWQQLEKEHFPMQLVARDPCRVIIRKP